jgi:hypothetical protein
LLTPVAVSATAVKGTSIDHRSAPGCDGAVVVPPFELTD